MLQRKIKNNSKDLIIPTKRFCEQYLAIYKLLEWLDRLSSQWQLPTSGNSDNSLLFTFQSDVTV